MKWNVVHHKSGPATYVLKVNDIIMCTVVEYRAPKSKVPFQWQVNWGFGAFFGEAESMEDGQKAAVMKLKELHEAFKAEFFV